MSEKLRVMAHIALDEIITGFVEKGRKLGLLDIRLVETIIDEETGEDVEYIHWNAELVERADGEWFVEEYVFDDHIRK